MSRIGKSIETKSRLVDSKAGGSEVRNDLFPFWSKENALILGVVIDIYHCEYIKKILKGRNLWPVNYILLKILKMVTLSPSNKLDFHHLFQTFDKFC